MMPALLVVALMPLISFAMFKFLFIPMIKAEIPEAGASSEIDPESVQVSSAAGEGEYSVEFENVVNNLLGSTMARYIQVSFTAYSSNPDFEAAVEKNRPRLLDAANTVLGNLTLADLEKREIRNIVRNQIKQGFNHVLQPPMVDEIYFSKFVVQ